MGCANLNSIDLGSCTSIGDSAFYLCKGLTSVDLGSCNSIGYAAFYSCSNLTSINLSGCASIGDYAFNGCRALGSVNLENCTSIGEKAFSGCFNLKPVISTNTAKVETDAFYNVPYVTITAENEEALENYCASITPNGNLAGLYGIKKVATLSDSNGNISINPDDIAENVTLSDGSTYYVTVSVDGAYSMDDPADAVSVKMIPDGESEAVVVNGNNNTTKNSTETASDNANTLKPASVISRLSQNLSNYKFKN